MNLIDAVHCLCSTTTRGAALGALLVLSACSGRAGEGTGTGGGAAAGGSAAGTGGSSGGGSSAELVGNVAVSNTCLESGACVGGALAQFFAGDAVEAGCERTTMGSCDVTRCGLSTAGVPWRFESAGTVTIAGTAAGALTLNFDGGYYQSVQSRLWDAGETLTFSAQGATVPAFSGRTVTAPGAPAVTSLSCDGGSCGTVSRAADFPIVWSAQAAELVVILTAVRTGGTQPDVVAACQFSTSPAQVPAAVMGLIPAQATLNLVTAAQNRNTFTAGAWTITARAQVLGPRGLLTPSN
ncbi:MAG: hypothetical protein JNK82_02145 [Myxococcaceae bacterium]|nr:hypothetical protein [Myxococcaceae bacterium]